MYKHGVYTISPTSPTIIYSMFVQLRTTRANLCCRVASISMLTLISFWWQWISIENSSHHKYKLMSQNGQLINVISYKLCSMSNDTSGNTNLRMVVMGEPIYVIRSMFPLDDNCFHKCAKVYLLSLLVWGRMTLITVVLLAWFLDQAHIHL